MSFTSKRPARDPYSLSTYAAEQPIRLDEARLDALALSLGQRREAYQPRDKPARSMLPGVDRPRSRPGWVLRALGRIAGRRPDEVQPAGASGETTVRTVALGEIERKPYEWLVEADASGPEEPGRA